MSGATALQRDGRAAAYAASAVAMTWLTSLPGDTSRMRNCSTLASETTALHAGSVAAASSAGRGRATNSTVLMTIFAKRAAAPATPEPEPVQGHQWPWW